MRAIWNDTVIAESDETIEIEGNQYFPPESLVPEFLTDSPTTSICAWKGTAAYYTVTVDGQENKDAAWYYPHPKEPAKQITGYVAFWKGVRVEP